MLVGLAIFSGLISSATLFMLAVELRAATLESEHPRGLLPLVISFVGIFFGLIATVLSVVSWVLG